MRMWEIRESHEHDSRYGKRVPREESGYRQSMRSYREGSLEEAYECGYEEGYKDAMRESMHSERRGGYR